MVGYGLSQIETFLAICRTRTFTAAALDLGLTQPAISARIRNLEQELGATLFDRRGSRVNLTYAGMLVRRHAEAGLAALDELKSQVRSLDPLSGYLRVGSSSTFAAVCLSRLLVDVEKQYPQLRLELTVSTSSELSRQVSAGLVDVAFLADPTVPAHAITRRLAQIPVSWFVAAGSGLPSASLSPSDLADKRVIVNPPPSASYSRATGWFRSAGLGAKSIDTCDSLPITLELVRTGAAMSVMPVWMAAEKMRTGEVIALRARPAFMPMQLCATYLPGAPMQSVEALVNLAQPIVTQVGTTL